MAVYNSAIWYGCCLVRTVLLGISEILSDRAFVQTA